MRIKVIIPIKNQSQHLGRCLDSVRWQLGPDDMVEVIGDVHENAHVVHGGIGIDWHIFNRFSSKVRFTYDNALNISEARNAAALDGEYDWIKFLDADDVLAPFALETFRQLKIPDSIHCITGPQIKVVNGCQKENGGMPNWRVMGNVNPTLPSMTFVRCSAFKEVGGFDPEINFEEDWDLWLRLWKKFGMKAFGSVPWPVCYYWISETERQQKAPVNHNTRGMDVREYFRKEYGINPVS